jgi:hypothetical protein
MHRIQYKLEPLKMHVFYAFKHYLGISGSQGGKLPNLKKILAIVHMPT